MKLITKKQIFYLKSGGRPIGMYKNPASSITPSEGWQGSQYYYTGRDGIKYTARKGTTGWEYKPVTGPTVWKPMPNNYRTTGGFEFNRFTESPAKQWAQQKINESQQMSQRANANIAQRQKANARANRSTRIPMKQNNDAMLQDALWNAGAFKNLNMSYEQAVDGIVGDKTKQAMKNAEAMGYVVDRTRGTVTKRQVSNNNKKSFLNDMYTYGYDNTNDTEAANQVVRTINESLPEGVQIPEDAGRIYGFASKLVKGLTGSDKASQAQNEFLDLDLTDPVQRQRAQELVAIMEQEEPRWGLRSGTLERRQKAMRGRYDLNQLHSGYDQKYHSYDVNTTFTPNGYGQAYVLSDPEMRRAHNEFVRNYVRNNKPTKLSDDGKSYIYSVPGGDPYAQYGDFSIVTDLDGNNIRYIDDWDFGYGKASSKHLPGMNEVIISDRLQ